MNITILNVVESTKPDKNGKPFRTQEVAYKNNTYGGKVEGFKVTQYQKAFNDVALLKPGETVEVNVEKKNGFNEWVSVSKAAPTEAVQVPAVRASAPERNSSPAVGKGNWETAEERAKRQVYIVRQSSIASAVAALSSGAKSPPSADVVIGMAKQFEKYVLATEPLTGFEDIPNIDPSFNIDPQVD